MAMDKDAIAVQRWIELPDKTKRFFEQLEAQNIETSKSSQMRRRKMSRKYS
jgi:hypothetical protein